MEKKTYGEKEAECEYRFNEAGVMWYMCTPGHLSEILFTCKEEFICGINLLAVSADKSPNIKLFNFEMMSNHLHWLMSGSKEDCKDMFSLYKDKLARYFGSIGKKANLSTFQPNLISVPDYNAFRNTSVYINRNGYLVNSAYTPYTYPWGTGRYFFQSPLEPDPSVPFSSLTLRERRKLSHLKDAVLSEKITVSGELINPLSYCHIKEAEEFFRDAHHYFSLISKNYEAFSDIAKTLGDSIFISDDEMYSAISLICTKKYNINRPSLIPSAAKIEIAKTMHFEYNASNKQIQRILRLDPQAVETLFPKAR